MTTLTVEIDKEKDLPVLQALLNKMGLKFRVEEKDNEDWGDLSDAEIEGINAGLANVEAGRVYSHEYVMAEMDKKIADFRNKNA